MLIILYQILSVLLLPLLLLWHLYRSLSRGRSPAFAQRLGFLPQNVKKQLAGRPVIWLHAVSVGEVMAARPLLKALKEQYPDHALLLSVTTETGRTVAAKLPEPDCCIYFPFDLLPAVKMLLGKIRPSLIIIMETEIWPTFCTEAARRKIPQMLVNGRISDRSIGRYQKMVWFFRHPLALFNHLCMQSELDKQRIISIGAPAERTTISGNLKYDIPWQQVPTELRNQLRQHYGIATDKLVVVAASTHPGEEELWLQAWQKVTDEQNRLQLVLVPRHPERAAELAVLLEKQGIDHKLRTSLAEDDVLMPGQVLLVDTVGELMKMYSLSDLTFVGGSLVPTGGHNLLEPASLGIPFIFGPYMQNFREISELSLQAGAGVQVADVAELEQALQDFLHSPELRQVIGANGLKMLRDNGGATKRIMELVTQYL